ncbi:exodeoxyribonuclease V subunit alpha [Egibacter rhizosphaerae]|uniref:RecBCD enzyme subunit RecD n=2 Tax=Egibacter rhizosphaerae TaxID=1670831 RepID=A0A411YL66_9ACTN|nr:exodeoxyribonuclease V subunit alpha [Egibacter rhizosphaerae]
MVTSGGESLATLPPATERRLGPEAAAGLGSFRAAGVLADADADVAAGLAALTGAEDPRAVLAAALAVRAPRVGHVCVDLAHVHEHVVLDLGPEEELERLGSLDWPDPATWAEAVASSPMVRAATRHEHPGSTADGQARPLVWCDGRLYLERYWRYEQELARRLRDLAGTTVASAGSPPSDPQAAAVELGVTRGLAIVTGGPGTGKTTTVVRLLATLLERAGRPVDAPLVGLAAPTGKAARRLAESLREGLATLDLPPWVTEHLSALEPVTLHRLLGVRPDHGSRFRHHRDRPLPHDLVVVDEASMVSLPMMAKLADAVGEQGRLVLVGDPDQLTSVEAGAVLGDLVGPAVPASRAVPSTSGTEPPIARSVVRLTRGHRFEATGGIGLVAEAIRQLDDDPAPALDALRAVGDDPHHEVDWRQPDADGGGPSELVASVGDAYRLVCDLAEAGRTGEALEALAAVRVLCAHRDGPGGVAWWNAAVSEWLGERGVRIDEPWFPGRPVLVTENDYQRQLFNGDVGVVTETPTGDGHARRLVAFPAADGGATHLAPARLPSHDTSFAMTIHKAQGSQFTHAVVVLPRRDSRICTRELVYTGLTRARQAATLVGSEEVVRAALARRIQRPSGLRAALADWSG